MVETLPFEEVKALLRDASIVVCHGGTGSLITALREGCHVIAIPRLFRLGEVYDDHQIEITEAFVKRGLVQMANDAEELAQAVRATATRSRTVATTEPTALTAFLESVAGRLRSRHAKISLSRSHSGLIDRASQALRVSTGQSRCILARRRRARSSSGSLSCCRETPALVKDPGLVRSGGR